MNYSIPKEFFKGVDEAGRDHDANVLVLESRKLVGNEPFGEQANILFRLVTKENVAGIIFSSNLMGSLSIEQLAEFYLRYRPLPIVSLGVPIKGFPSIIADANACQTALIEHLVGHHQKRKIVFIGGKQGNLLNAERLSICNRALAAHNLSLDPALVLSTGFSHDGGEKAVRILMDERKKAPVKDFDAIIAGNDYAARGAFMELRRRDVRVPAELAITGFDDLYPIRCLSVPLTTIYIPFKEMGYKAVELLAEQLNGGSVPELTAVPAQLKIRNSCGCGEDFSLQEAYADKLPKTVNEKLVHDPQSFLDELNEAMIRFNITSDDLPVWDELLVSLRLNAPEAAPERNGIPERPAGCDRKTWESIGRSIYVGFTKMRDTNTLNRIETNFSSSIHISQITEILASQLPLLGIKECYLVFYDKPPFFIFPQELTETSRLMMAFSEGERLDLPETGITFPTARILPEEYTRHESRKTMIVDALYQKDHQIGYILFYAGAYATSTYTHLRGSISNALQGALLVEKVNEHAEQLAKANVEIRILNERLNKEILKLEKSNRELEQFAFVASHDLQEPLRKLIFFEDKLKRDYRNTLDENTIDDLARMNNAVGRMQSLIQDLLQYSRVTTAIQPFEKVDLNEVVKGVMSDLEIRMRDTGAEVKTGHLPQVYADSLQMRQLFQNIIGNAIKYQRKNVPPVIDITSQTAASDDIDFCEIKIRDNGIGFDNKYADRIFVLFQRLHGKGEYEGTGIGLSICKKIVEQHGGAISASSKEGEGSTFCITLPLEQKKNRAHGIEPAK